MCASGSASRSARETGVVTITSPRAERRMMRIRGPDRWDIVSPRTRTRTRRRSRKGFEFDDEFEFEFDVLLLRAHRRSQRLAAGLKISPGEPRQERGALARGAAVLSEQPLAALAHPRGVGRAAAQGGDGVRQAGGVLNLGGGALLKGDVGHVP